MNVVVLPIWFFQNDGYELLNVNTVGGGGTATLRLGYNAVNSGVVNFDANINNNISRTTVINAANHFGPFDTGFGNSITWTDKLPRIPSLCMYRVKDDGSHWVFDTKQECLDPSQATT